MWLLGIYTLLVAVSETMAVGMLFLAERWLTDYSSIVFVTSIFVALIVPWFIAVRLTEGWEK